MPHIHTETGEHDLTASAFIVRTDREEPALLLHMHKKLGKLMQPGGHVELQENPWQAILHEIIEETGYSPSQLKVLQPAMRMNSLTTANLHPQPIVLNTHDFGLSAEHRHTDIAFAFVTDQEPAGIPVDGESSDLRWKTYRAIEDLGPEDIAQNVREIGYFVLSEITGVWEPVDIVNFAD